MANATLTLHTKISEKIKQLCSLGYQNFDDGDAKTALRRFYSAWNLLPKPQSQWEEAGWILTALGDVYFAKGDYQQGSEALRSALHCPNAMGNPVIHLRLGQCHAELDEHAAALAQFKQVIHNGGRALFDKEDKKYLALLESVTME